MSDPIISILCLTYNRLSLSIKYLPDAFKRIGNMPHEILIWDNGSDGTYEWFKEYKNRNENVREVIQANKNIGQDAINILASRARGKYILKLDDDIVVPLRFGERLVNAFGVVNDPKLVLLAWDMGWGSGTFSSQYQKSSYVEPGGRTLNVPGNGGDKVLVHYTPGTFTIAGACRMSPREEYLSVPLQPRGIVYGADPPISKSAGRNGLWGGYLNHPTDCIHHCAAAEDPVYRALKAREQTRVYSGRAFIEWDENH